MLMSLWAARSLASAGLEVWNISNSLPANVVAMKPATQTNYWQMQFSGPLQSQSDLPYFIAPGEAVFVNADGPAQIPAVDPSIRIRYYHEDHIGSSASLSDLLGSRNSIPGFFCRLET